ncbi:LamG-like jellyroll fold domain-containing protein [Adhaeretor mobilis]|uniref:Ice-binding protein C-terminal domain-containing protein n=1 Tax=Adhaeretor mobilis TaxID=1930276 RepID=A0A517MW76_9BACT|nr:LamG-like jellyroll fold domain-containing protein [Adhaeretor mobilis]QDS99132.1 hypothetical protein HG15A2_24240 [Adhaeretor mobilis]
MRSNKRVLWVLTAMIAGLLSSNAVAATVGLWTFNEKAVGQVGSDGDSVLDTSGSANVHNGTIFTDAGDNVPYVAGSPTATDGPALQLERGTGTTGSGISDRVELAGHADFTYSNSDSFTMEILFASDQVVGGAGGNGTGPLVTGIGTFWLDDDTEGKIMFSSGFGTKVDGDSGGTDTRGKTWSTTFVNDGEWHHVAAVFDGTAQESRVYVDGILEGTTDWSAWAGNASYSGTQGTGNGGTLYFGATSQDLAIRELDASVDFVRFSNEALSPENFYNPVPEPSTLILCLVLGVAGNVVRKRG